VVPSMISVSIAMATYNGRKHILRQLESLAAQSQPPAELVITDDRSEDDTLAIIDAFARTASFPVNVYRNETRLGYRANFMRAASLCHSELIAFCDQDDYWYPQKIAASVKPFNDPEVLLSYHDADVVNEDGTRIGSLATRATPISSGPWFFAPGFTEVFRRSLLQLSGLWPNSLDSIEGGERSAHDKWFYFLATVFGRVIYVDETLVAYNQHGNNTYGWTKLSFREWMKYILRNRANEIFNFANAAQNRATILDAAKPGLEEIWRERAAASSEYYQKIYELCVGRSGIYTGHELGDRLKALRAVLRKSGYAGAWGLGRKAFLVDICIGVPFSPLLRSNSS
jgi:glycosyltransferase involved in cell wall biosynthesis